MVKATWPRGWVISGLAVLVGGCSLAPDYEQPDTTVPAGYGQQIRTNYDGATGVLTQETIDAAALRTSESVSVDTPWQQFFHDEQLKQLIEIALKGNRNLQIAIARMEQAQALWGVQRGQMYPQLGASLQGSRQSAPNPSGGGTSISSQYMAGVAVTSFELDLFGRKRSLSESAFQKYLSSAEGARAVQIALVADTAIQYYRERMATALLEFTQQTYDARKKTYNLIVARYRSGVASQIDVVQSKTLVDAAAAQLSKLTREQAQARNALTILIGQPLPASVANWPELAFDEQTPRTPVGLPSDLLLRRPDIRGAENNLRAAGADIGAARAAFVPEISLTGALGVVSSALGDLFTAGVLGWSVAPALSQPIFAGGSLEAGLEQATAAQREAVASYQQTVEQGFREVSDALAGEATLEAQWTALAAQTASSQRFLDLSQARFFNQIDNFLAVQTAQIELYNARTEQVQITFELLANRVNLYKALGGGWDESVPGAVMAKRSPSIEMAETQMASSKP